MERIRGLNLYQKTLLLILTVMAILFAVIYAVVSSKAGFLYRDALLLPSQENSNTVYSGKIHGIECCFTVSPENTVTFRYGNTVRGPYTVTEDPSAVPEEHDYMTGVEICCGEKMIFRGGYFANGGSKSNLVLVDEKGERQGLRMVVIQSNGWEGNFVDQMTPSASVILQLVNGPELTSRGEWQVWFFGLLVSLTAAVSMLFAEELFQLDMSFRMRNSGQAEPSDWEIAGRYVGWTALSVLAFVLYWMGLQIK